MYIYIYIYIYIYTKVDKLDHSTMWISLLKLLQDKLVWKILTFTSLNDHVIWLGLGLKL